MSHRRLTLARLALTTALLVAAIPASAGAGLLPPGLLPSGPPVTIAGNEASVTLGLAGLSIELTLEFEQVVGLTPAGLGITSRLVNPVELVGRLPDTLISLPAALPLLVSVEPPAAGGLSFSGVTTVGVHTHNLPFVADSPLRLYKASVGGPFVDITESMGTGSYRARGSTGGFSQFLILVDLRPTSAVVEQKLDTLDALLASSGIGGPLRSDLDARLATARSRWDSGNVVGAIGSVEGFAAAVKTAADAGLVPNVWRSARDLNNVAGNLRAAAGTLRFSLALAE